MSSGSRETVVSLLVLALSIAWVGTLAARRVAAQAGSPATQASRWPPPHNIVVPPDPPPPAPPADPHVLRVCADPNNLPFSDRRGGGFENRIAEIVARDLHRRVEYYWQPQRRGFIRTTLKAGLCDVVAGVPVGFDLARVTKPYYRSSYVFVTRADRGLTLSSFDDPRLRSLRIGIPITGNDYANPPAAQALADRHLFDNVRGYTVYGDYSQPHPSWGVLEAVARGEVDVAVEWGPLAGYFARREHAPVRIAPIGGRPDPKLPVSFDIGMGVRHGDTALASAIDAALARHATEIRRVLDDYGVPYSAPGGAQKPEVRG